MTNDDRYRCADHPDGGTVIYDREDGDAWIRSSYAVELPNRKVGRSAATRRQVGRADAVDGDRWASETAHSGTRVSNTEATDNDERGYTDTENSE